MEKKETTKSICLKLSLEDYNLLVNNATKRNLDKTNYMRYLIDNDKDDLYSENASRALQQISSYAEKIIDSRKLGDLNNKADICEWCDFILEGVKALWRCFR